jgi:hypothetical protein
MPLNLTKTAPKPAAPAKTEPQVVTANPEVDELAELLDWQAKQAKSPKLARLGELKKKFSEQAMKEGEDDPDAPVMIQGQRYILKYGAQSKDRFIKDREKLAEYVEDGVLFDIASFPIGKVDDLLSGAQKKDVFGINRGARTLTIEGKPVPKGG